MVTPLQIIQPLATLADSPHHIKTVDTPGTLFIVVLENNPG
jgi:hypothetical protein